MKRTAIRLWFAYPAEEMPPGAARKCTEMMSAQERTRLEGIRPENVRRQYLIAHSMVRRALSSGASTPPADWRFRMNPFGKPEIDPECGLRFNLSHSLQLAVCAVSEGFAVGVDTEHVSRALEILDIADDVFSSLELAQLAKLVDGEKLDRALSLWVLKEAYVKARGIGLSLPLKEFSMVFGGDEGIRLQVHNLDEQDSKRWRFCLMEHQEHQIALFAETRCDMDLELWELRHLMGAPTQLASPAPTWFPISKASF